MWTGEHVLSAFDLPVNHLYRRVVTLLGYCGIVSMLEDPKTAYWGKGDEVTVGPRLGSEETFFFGISLKWGKDGKIKLLKADGSQKRK